MLSPPNQQVGETVIASHELGSSIKFHEWLLAQDELAAERLRGMGCARCAGPLHRAHYPRKVRGLDDEALRAGGYDRRLSLCCGREGCRARSTPPSLRFGRRVYALIAVLLLSVAARDTSDTVGIVHARGAPSWHTRVRWLSWWRTGLVASAWFQSLCALFALAPDRTALPDALLSKFEGSLSSRSAHLLVLLSPLTTSSVAPERSRILMAR